jgi:hypothetical protein
MFDAVDVVLVPFPFTDHAKRRPILALTTPDTQGDFIACLITSRDRWINARPLLPTDMAVGTQPHRRTTETFRLAVATDLCRFITAAPAATQG